MQHDTRVCCHNLLASFLHLHRVKRGHYEKSDHQKHSRSCFAPSPPLFFWSPRNSLFFSLAVYLATALTSCSTLTNSASDENSKSQGSFLCTRKPWPSSHSESKAEIDVARIRCQQDHWLVKGKRLVFQRFLYQDPDCQNEIGSLFFESKFEGPNTSLIQSTPCSAIRLNIDWVAEKKGQCMLNHFSRDTPYSAKEVLGSCPTLLPSFCRQPVPIEFKFVPAPAKNAPHDSVLIQSSHYSEQCNRYAEGE